MTENPLENTTASILEHYKKIEQSYTYNLQVYKSLFDLNPEAVFSIDLEGNFTSANKVMLAKAVCDLEHLITLNFADFVHPDYKEIANKSFEEVKKGAVQEYQLKAISTIGTVMDVALKCLPIYVDEVIIGAYVVASDITERLKTENEMKEVLENLAKAYAEKDKILESIAEGFFALDKAWNFIYCNKVVEHIWGIEKQQIIGRNFWDLIDKSNANQLFLEFTRAMTEKTRVDFEMYYKPFSIWLEITVYPNENGLSSIVKIINEEKRVEQLFNLEKNALELNTQIGSTVDDAVTYLIDGMQDIHPDMMCSLLHVRDGALYNWYAPKLPEEYKKLIDNFPIGPNQGSCGTAAYFKTQIIVEDIASSEIWGDYKEIAASFGFKACWSLPLLNKEKQVFATFGVYLKVARRPTQAELNSAERVRNLLATIILNKQAEEEIFLSKERYDIVSKATNDAIWDCDLEKQTIVWNNGITSIFGYKPEQVENTFEWGWNRVHPKDRSEAIAKLVSHLEGGVNTFSDEFRCLCADGSYKYVLNKVFVMNDAKTGKAKRLIGSLQDISEQKNKELQLSELNEKLKERAEQLATSNTELERFAYIASHDLQEPLRTITSFLQLLKRKYAGKLDDAAETYINYAVDGSDRMRQLIMDMLEYSRVNTQLNLNEEVDMQRILDDVLFNYSGKIKLSDAVIVSENLPKVYAMKTQMIQLLQNLISNAIKYQKPNIPPHIIVKAEEKETEWEFSVKDNGIGIDEKYFEKIFVIFQRLHSKTQFTGTGIGLAICKKIIEKHKGHIWVVSALNEGTTFYFTIPKK
jgi:PAS domain S-box-containing protein